MDWEDLRFFFAVATQQGLAAAARDLGVSQATVWRRIRQLESSLEVRLFTRRGTGYALSTTGEQLFKTATRVARRKSRAFSNRSRTIQASFVAKSGSLRQNCW